MDTLDKIISDSLDTLAEKKQWSGDLSRTLKQAASECNLDSIVLRRVKDYNYYHGLGWDGSPLALDKSEKFKDKITPVFKKLLTVIDDLAQTEQLELLDEYINALSDLGIHITFDNYIPANKTSNKEVSDAAISAGVTMQAEICSLADKIKDEDSLEAEVQGFGPKTEYTKLINIAYTKRKGKDVEDKCQETCTNLNTAIQSYLTVQNNDF